MCSALPEWFSTFFFSILIEIYGMTSLYVSVSISKLAVNWFWKPRKRMIHCSFPSLKTVIDTFVQPSLNFSNEWGDPYVPRCMFFLPLWISWTGQILRDSYFIPASNRKVVLNCRSRNIVVDMTFFLTFRYLHVVPRKSATRQKMP